MAYKRQRRRRQQRRRKQRIIQPARETIDGEDFINSIPDCKIQQPAREIINGADFINSMPDEILHHILSFIPTDLAMRTSVLSKRWRHVWSETPCLYIDVFKLKPGGMNQTLTSYTAPKITSFNLVMSRDHNTAPQVDSWIEFAISHNVQKLSVSIVGRFSYSKTYSFPATFYLSSSVKQLTVTLAYMIPTCIVSWKSLRSLSLRCNVPDESIDNILSGCPVLESLTMDTCGLIERLDLSKSPSLKRLDINRRYQPSGPIEIVAPHIHYLRLTYSMKPSTLVDVSSLTEANLNFISRIIFPSDADLYQTMVLEMLAKSRNVERLTLGETLLQILSLAELRGVPFPTLKVKTLIVKTDFVRSIIPGISRLLQNSPDLKTLSLHTMHIHDIMDMHLLKGLYRDQCWRSVCEVFPTSTEIYKMLGCNDATSKLLSLFMELVLRNTKTLDRMVVWLGGSSFDDAQWFEELLQMVGTLSQYNNISIVLKRSNYC